MDRLIGYFKLFKKTVGKRLYLILFLALVAAVFEGMGVSLFIPLLQGEKGPVTEVIKKFFSILELPYSLLWILLLAIIFFSLRTIFLIWTTEYHGRLTGALLSKLREGLLSQLFQVDYGYFLSKELGYINNALTVEINNVAFCFKLYVNVLTVAFFAAIYLFIALVVNLQVVTILCLLAVPGVYIAKKINSVVSRYSIEQSKHSAAFQTFLIQTLEKYKYLKATNSHRGVLNKIFAENNRLGDIIYRLRFWGGISEYGFLPMVVLVIGGIVYFSVEIMGRNIAEIVYFLFLIKQTSDRLISSQVNYRKLLNHIGSISVLEKVEKELEQNEEHAGQLKVENFQEGIRFEDVDFWHEGKKPILKNLNLQFSMGRMAGFVGHLGAGKSTIFNLITGLLSPSRGDIKIGGVSYQDVDMEHLRRYIGYVTQEDVIFNDTVLNNITLWRDDIDLKKVKKIFDDFELEWFIRELPAGYDTVLGESGLKISGGQRQIIFFVREMLKEPKILLLDEFTSAMDAQSEERMIALLEKIKKDKILILISHRLSAIKQCDWIYMLENGQIIEEGTYENLYERKGKFHNLVDKQALR